MLRVVDKVEIHTYLLRIKNILARLVLVKNEPESLQTNKLQKLITGLNSPLLCLPIEMIY